MRVYVCFLPILAAIFHGCAIEPTDLSDSHELVTRGQIEARLGPSVAGADLQVGRLEIYEYDTGRVGTPVESFEGGPGGAGVAGLIVLLSPVLIIDYLDRRASQKGHMAVLYSSDNNAKLIWLGGRIGSEQALQEMKAILRKEVIACETPDSVLSKNNPKQCLVRGMPVTILREREYELLLPAREGDPTAMYDYADSLRNRQPIEALMWFCLAAHQGHYNSQKVVGTYYQWGGSAVSKDPVRAYLWFTLALDALPPDEDPSIVARSRRLVERSMAPDQIAEAKRLVAEWQPNPAECETLAAAR